MLSKNEIIKENFILNTATLFWTFIVSIITLFAKITDLQVY